MTASASAPASSPVRSERTVPRRLRDVPLRTGPVLRCIDRAGAPGGETVLLLHGYSDSGRSWDPVIAALPPDWRVLAPDQRGHGDSERPREGYGVAQLAADAAALLDAAGASRVTVVGHSMGSFVAQQLALDHPNRVERLVLVCGAARFPGAEEFLSEVRTLTDPVSEDFIRSFQRACLRQPIPEAVFEQAVAESRKLPARVWHAIAEGFPAFDVRARLREIVCPTLVVWGAHDAFFLREQQEELRAGLRGAEFVEHADAGHAPHWEDPARFARDLAAWVAATSLAVAAARIA